jgi:hypothetical protein
LNRVRRGGETSLSSRHLFGPHEDMRIQFSFTRRLSSPEYFKDRSAADLTNWRQLSLA